MPVSLLRLRIQRTETVPVPDAGTESRDLGFLSLTEIWNFKVLQMGPKKKKIPDL